MEREKGITKNMKYGLSDETYHKIKALVEKYNQYEFKIFGSRARGDYKINSDIDMVVIDCLDNEEKFKIKNEMDLLNIPYTIDLIFIEDITKKELLDSIQKEAKRYE